MIDGAREIENALRGDAIKAGLEADDATVGSRTNHRADSLGAERKGTKPSRHSGSEATAGAARCMFPVVRIVRRARFKIGKFSGNRFAEDYCASRAPELLDTDRLRSGEKCRWDLGAGARCKAIHMKNIFHTDQSPIQRRARAVGSG